MTREEAEEHAKDMTYRDAVYNALQGKCIPYRKATLIKLYELLDKLEQEPCDTCEHSDEIDGSNCYECVKGIRGRYNPQPKTGHWIPVSERLPEADGRYLCTYEDDIEENCVDFGSYKNGEWYVDKVIAWMPLPAPFEPREWRWGNERSNT